MFMGIMYMISFKNDNRDHKVAVESIAQSPISKKNIKNYRRLREGSNL